MSSPLETIEDLEDMRVSDLREFIERHGQSPLKIPRSDGTPGPPLKADLLRAAKQILSEVKTLRSPMPIAPDNPFQRRISTSDPSLRPPLPSTQPSDHRNLGVSTSISQHQPPHSIPGPSPLPRMTATPARMQPSTFSVKSNLPPKPPSMTPRISTPLSGGRKSHIAINPKFSHLFSSSSNTPARASTTSFPSQAPQSTRRTSMDLHTLRDPRLTVARHPLPSRATNASSGLPQRVATTIPSGSTVATAVATAKIVRPTQDSPSTSNPPSQTVPSMPTLNTEKNILKSTPPGTVPSLPTSLPAAVTSTAPTSGAKPFRSLDPVTYPSGIVPERPSSRIRTSHSGGIITAAENISFPNNNSFEDDRSMTKHKLSEQYVSNEEIIDVDGDEITPAPSHEGGDTSDGTNQVDTDYESSAMGESDAGSTVETDDELQGDEFSTWNASQIRAWLSSQDIKPPQTNIVSELLPIARAHKMFLETNGDTEVTPVPAHTPSRQEMVYTRKDKRTGEMKHRRDRKYSRGSAPPEDEEPEVIEVRLRSPKRRSSNHASKRGRQSTGVQGVTMRTRIHTAILSAMTGIFLSSLVAAVIWLYQNAMRPYCDNFDLFTKDVEDVALDHGPLDGIPRAGLGGKYFPNITNVHLRCIPCPSHGICRNGKLSCASGYINVGGRCVEDGEFSLYTGALAMEAFSVLSDVAGQALCGNRKSRYVRWDEVTEVVRKSEINLPKRRFFQGRRPVYDENKFDAAMTAARRHLIEDDDVEVRSDGELTSLKPTMNLRCRVRHFIWVNLGRVMLTMFTMFVLTYLRVKIYLNRKYAKHIDSLYINSIEVLRLHKEDYESKYENYAFVKDVVLRADIVGQPTKKNIETWKDVEKKLNADPRILRASRTVDGVPSYTFEWAGRRRSSSVGDGLSRRSSSFSSRASLDSLELEEDLSNRTPSSGRRMLGRFLGGWSDREGS